MNTPSPLLPQGATPPQAKNSLYFKVLMILAVHVVVIGGMLMQGCRDTAPSKDTTKTDSSTPGSSDTSPAGGTATATPAPTSGTPTADVPNNVNPQMSNAYNSTVTTAPAPQVQPQAQPQVQPVSAGSAANAIPSAKPGEIMGTAGEYVIAKGDTLAAIAHKNSISLKALTEANPGVNPKKLKIGQKLQIPAGTSTVAATASAGAASPTTEAVGAEGSLYTVKSGDNLLKIAKAHSTSYKKIMALNDLKTTSIHAGQKLKMPAPKGSEPVATPSAAPASASASTPVSTSAVAAN